MCIFAVVRARDDPSLTEEIKQQDRSVFRQDATDGFDTMVEISSQDAQRLESSNRADLEIRRAEHEASYPRMDRSAEAHQARLDRAVKRGSDETVVLESLGRISHRQHFRMSRRVVQRQRGVVASPNDGAVGDDDGADRNLSGLPRERGFLESYPHEALMLVHHWRSLRRAN